MVEIKNEYFKLTWYQEEITSVSQLRDILTNVKNGFYDYMTFDTETTGLHIKYDKPYIITFGLVISDIKVGYAYAMYLPSLSETHLTYFEQIFLNMKRRIAFNTKFDLHMLTNIGIDCFSRGINDDVAFYIRTGLPAIPEGKGGITLALKPVTKKFIYPDADLPEKHINTFKTAVLKKRNKKLKELGYNPTKIQDFLKDKINELSELPKQVQDIYNDKQYDPNYYPNIPWEEIKQYAVYDSIYVAECYEYFYPISKERNQLGVVEREIDDINPLFEMESIGIKLNRLYLQQAKLSLKAYIIRLRKKLNDIAETNVKVGQHKLIKQVFSDKFNLDLEKVNSDTLEDLTVEDGAGYEFAQVLTRLRTLEKWYSTYVCKWLDESKGTDRIYTTFNQVGAVSGRFSSDFQQFPKDTIYDDDGNVVFIPRRIVMVDRDNSMESLCFIDFAAEEMRIQALYTVLINKPDKNLVNAFIPFGCDKDSWIPTDLHTTTTLNAFPELDKNQPDFKHYRYLGKRANFLMLYGGTIPALMSSLKIDKDTATKLYNAYYKAYPMVKEYANYVSGVLRYQKYITNLFGRRYYDAPAHNCRNYLIQGSCADYLKIKIKEIYDFLKPYKSQMLFMVHDEIVFDIAEGEAHLIPKLKQIMEDVSKYTDFVIPLVGEIELTRTTWDAKKEYTC